MTTADLKRTSAVLVGALALVVALTACGVLSTLAGAALDVVDDGPAMGQTARVAVVGMFNRVTVGQSQTGAAQAEKAGTGLFGWTAGDWGVFAVFAGILLVAIGNVCAVVWFFSPRGWE